MERDNQLMTVTSRKDSDWLNAKLPAYSQSQKEKEESKSKKSAQSFDEKSKGTIRSDMKSWPVGFGRCHNLHSNEIIHGKGILTAKYLDLLTLQKSPAEV